MADNDPTRAGHACNTCRTRKRACDKLLPRCSYCDSKGLLCGYERGHDKSEPLRGKPLPALSIKDGEGSLAARIKDHVLSHLDASNTTPEGVCERYFKSFDQHLSILTPNFFHQRYRHAGSQQAEVSILLMAMHLLVDDVDMDAYLTLKSLFATVQASEELSLMLVQANLLIAAFEYTIARTNSAANTIASCSMMARILKLDVPPDGQLRLGQERMEAWNTWCGIAMLEIVVLAEIDITSALSGRLNATNHGTFHVENSDCPQTTHGTVGGPGWCKVSPFSHQVKASWLLSLAADLTLTNISFNDVVRMDEQVKAFLQEMLDQEMHLPLVGGRAPALATTIQTLFFLHKHVLERRGSLLREHPQLEQLSRATMTMATRLMLDIASSEDHQHHLEIIHTLPLCCRENIKSAREWAAQLRLDGIAMWRLMELERHLCEKLNVNGIEQNLNQPRQIAEHGHK